MKIKIEIKSIFGKVLFALEKENNTMKDTIEEAVRNNVNLEDVNLRNANLKNANLRNVNLRNANLEGANLEYANLEDVNLRNANLKNANLEYANLRNVNLEDVNLRNANLEGAENKETAILPIFCKWSYGIKGDLIKIGCKEKTTEQWDLWFDSEEEEYSTSRNTKDFKQIQAVYNALKAYYLTLNKQS